MADASRDGNFVPTLLGASTVDGKTPVPVYADPTTHRLLVDATSGVVGPVSSTDMAIARWDGATGLTLQDSLVFITDAGLLQFLGTTSSFPALKRSTTILQARLADDSAYTSVDALSYKASGTAPVADGTYTVGAQITPVTGTTGTITVKGGIITAIQQAT